MNYNLKMVSSEDEAKEIGYTGWNPNDLYSVVIVNDKGVCPYSLPKISDVTVFSVSLTHEVKFYEISESLEKKIRLSNLLYYWFKDHQI